MKSGPCFIIARITLDKMGLIKRVLLLERGLVPGRRWLTRPGPPTGGGRGGFCFLSCPCVPWCTWWCPLPAPRAGTAGHIWVPGHLGARTSRGTPPSKGLIYCLGMDWVRRVIFICVFIFRATLEQSACRKLFSPPRKHPRLMLLSLNLEAQR